METLIDTPAEPPKEPPAPRGPKRLFRAPNAKLAGVAEGIGAYFNVDPVLVRLLFIVALFTGIGFVAYIVLWLVLPRAKAWPPPGYDEPAAAGKGTAEGASGVASGLAIVGLAALLGSGLDGVGAFLLPAALLGFGLYLLNQQAGDGQPATLPSSSSPGDHSFGATAGTKAQSTRPGLVTPTVLSALAVGLGLALALQAGGALTLSAAGLASVALVVVGGGLLASLRYGPARGLVPTGLVLTAVLLAAPKVEAWAETGAPWSRHDSARHDPDHSLDPGQWAQLAIGSWKTEGSNAALGKMDAKPSSLDNLEPQYTLGAGKILLNLTELNFENETRNVHVEVGMGKVIVALPERLSVAVRAEVGTGKIDILGERGEGEHDIVVDHSETVEGAGQLNLDIEVGLGKVEVRRGNG